MSFGRMPVDPEAKVEFVKDSIVDTKAWVTLKNPKGEQQEITLEKVDGKGVVNMEPKK